MERNRRITHYLIALFIIVSLNFVLPRLMPGDPLQAIYGDEALLKMSEATKQELVERFALDQTWGEQYISYLGNLLRGNLGYSYYYNQPVLAVITGFWPWTMLLAGLALIISTLLGVVLGIESGYRRGQRLDKILFTGLMSLHGFPDFVVGVLLLLVFGVYLGVAPVAGSFSPYSGESGWLLVLDVGQHLALPLLALVLTQTAGNYFLTRNTMITVLREPYILTARGKGCSPARICYRHAGRSSLLPVATATGMHFVHLVTGALFVEVIFTYPGMGWLLYNSLQTRDYPLMEGILLVTALTMFTVNFLVDCLYQRLDPRIEYAY